MPEVSEQFSIEAVPAFVFLKLPPAAASANTAESMVILDRLDGANAAQLTRLVEQYSQQAQLNDGLMMAAAKQVQHPASSSQQAFMESTETLEERLDRLTTMAPVVLFMKGTPMEPKCGFSRQIVDLLAKQRIAYSAFDILTDDQVRQGLKDYAQWPTYPQLWINGELVGGLDIVKELSESGELKSLVPAVNLQSSALPSSDDSAEQPLNERLKRLVNQSKLMLFIKGTPEEPRCGFSRQLLEMLNELGCRYEYFDILADERVRQGLKEYSEWPTYPQVYIDGQLVGGLDIVKEMIDSGEFQQQLEL